MAELQKIVDAVRRSVPPGRDFYALHEPIFEGREWEYVKECLDTGWVSSVGKFVDRFEADLADFTGARRAVAVVNGTAGLHAALHLCGVASGDEVLMPSLTFVATANAAGYLGATPHFIDCETVTLGICPERLAGHLRSIARQESGRTINAQTGRRIGALICMHVFGHPVQLDDLREVCADYSIPLIEDAAEGLGSRFNGNHVGGSGRIGVLSFNGNKTITTGGGGALLINDDELADRAKHVTTTAKQPHRWEFFHDEVGFNYRLPNLNAAMGCAQLEMLPRFLARKARLAARYREAFSTLAVEFVDQPKGAESNFWLNAIRLPDATMAERDKVLAALNDARLQSRPIWRPMHELPMYANCPRTDMSVTERLSQEIVNLPSSPYPDSEDA